MSASRPTRSVRRLVSATSVLMLPAFAVMVASPAHAAPTSSDDFERPDSATLGEAWVTPSWSQDIPLVDGAAVTPGFGARTALPRDYVGDSATIAVESLTGDVEYAGISVGVNPSTGQGIFVKVQNQNDGAPGFDTVFVYQGVQGSPSGFSGGANRNIANMPTGTLSVTRDGTSVHVVVTPEGSETPALDETFTMGDVAYGNTVAISSFNGGRIESFGAQAPAEDVVTFTSSTPDPLYVGQEVPLSATAESGAEVAFAAVTPETCTVTGSTATVTAAGTCTVEASSDGGTSRSPGSANQSFVVSDKITSTVELNVDPATAEPGQPVTATATVATSSGMPSGTVTFAVDGTPVGDDAVDESGTATLSGLTPDLGSHIVRATFTPASTTSTEGSSDEAGLSVAQVATSTSVTLGNGEGGEVATIAVAPAPADSSASVPTGSVQVYVAGRPVGGPVSLTDGSVSVPVRLANGEEVAAAYSGDDVFLASSGSTSRSNPTITASVSSAKAPRLGWYRGPVTVTFTCDAGGSTLTADCPAPVVLSGDGAAKSVTQTITTIDGGVATVTRTVGIDTTGPRVRLIGVLRKDTNLAALRRVGATASDAVSGVERVRVYRTGVYKKKVTVIARATDRAGNVTEVRRTFRLR
ncbi:hypothetical protein GCM10027425_14230 [Alteromonas gracilis]